MPFGMITVPRNTCFYAETFVVRPKHRMTRFNVSGDGILWRAPVIEMTEASLYMFMDCTETSASLRSSYFRNDGLFIWLNELGIRSYFILRNDKEDAYIIQ